MSDFYSKQLAAKKSHGNKPEFTYTTYSKEWMEEIFFVENVEKWIFVTSQTVIIHPCQQKIIANFLDILHSLKVELDMASLLLVMQFLRYEGKSGKNKNNRLLVTSQLPDKSEFETALLEILKVELELADLALDTRLIVTYLCNKFDAFDGVMENVIWIWIWFIFYLLSA